MLYFLRKLNDIHSNLSTADRDKLPTRGRGLHLASQWRSSAIGPGRVVHGRRFRTVCWHWPVLGDWSTKSQIFW